MKHLALQLVGLILAGLVAPAAHASCGVDSVGAAIRFADAASQLKTVVELNLVSETTVFDAQRLSQAADRLPDVIATNPSQFNIDRKFRRITSLVLRVSEGIADEMHCGAPLEVEEALAIAIDAYDELADALAVEAPAPIIVPGPDITHSR